MEPLRGDFCAICGERLISPHLLENVPAGAGASCGFCRRAQLPFVRATAYGSYDGGLRELIHLLKYEQVRPAASLLGRMLAEVTASLARELADPVMVPVPLHADKMWQRGFNQAELIAEAAARKLPIKGLQLKASVLRRMRATESQTGLTRHQRRENIRGAFVVTRPAEIAGREILLVDDVFTTGTTVSECARVLRRAGTGRVWVATVARVLKSEAVATLEERDEIEKHDPRAHAAAGKT